MRSVVVLVLMLAAAPVVAQERVAGLLSLPQVFGPRQCAPFEPEQVPLHHSPNDGKPFAFIRVDQNWSFAPHGGCEGLEVTIHQGEQKIELPTREYDYEMPGAIVIDQRGEWFKVQLRDGAAWLRASESDHFMPLKDLYEEFVGVTTINAGVATRLSASANGAAGPILPAVKPSDPVRVVEIRNEWVQIELLSNSACTAADNGPPEVVATGWLPLHTAKGEPTVWFSSRGC